LPCLIVVGVYRQGDYKIMFALRPPHSYCIS
jgi:hypothetical protein